MLTAKSGWPDGCMLAVSAAASALLVDLGRFHRIHHGDTILSALISLYHWTPFYWDQNRFGMLIPLLAIPFRNPLWNLLFQCGLSLLAGFFALMLFARYVAADSSWSIAALVAVLAGFAAGPDWPIFQAFWPDQVYAPGIATLLLGLLLLSPRGPLSLPRLLAGVGLIAIAYWVNMATPLLAFPLVLLRRALLEHGDASSPRTGRFFDRRLAWLIALFALLAAAYWAFTRLGPHRVTSLNPLTPARWPQAWRALAGKGWETFASHPRSLALLAPALLGLGFLAVPSTRADARRAVRGAAVLVLTAMVYFFEVSTSNWVQTNEHNVRYLFPSFMMLHAALSVLAAVPVLALLGRWAAPFVRLASLPLLCAGAVLAFGRPSLALVRADLDKVLGKRTPDVIEARCTHLAGNHWTVWPAVFHANWKLYEQGQRSVILGVSDHAASLMAARPPGPPEKLRVCVPLGDGEAQDYLTMYSFPKLEPLQRYSTIELLVAARH